MRECLLLSVLAAGVAVAMPAETENVTCSGRVIGADGAAIEGALVEANRGTKPPRAGP